MTDDATETDLVEAGPTDWGAPEMRERLRKRYRRERAFRSFGLAAVIVAGLFLVVLLGNIFQNGVFGFLQTSIEIDVTFEAELLPDPAGMTADAFAESVRKSNMLRVLQRAMQNHFPDVTERRQVQRLTHLVSAGSREQLRRRIIADPAVIGTTQRVSLLASDEIDQVVKGRVDTSVPEANRKVSDRQLNWLAALEEEGRVSIGFHTRFLTGSDSREPELVGVRGAILGSVFTLLVTLLTAFPVGLFAAIYLEEFAPKNRLTDIIEININNLAAVPSIVFGLLGLAVFLSFMGMPRSAPLVAGLTLALITLPTVIIAARASIAAVPPSLRDAALALGGSRMQVVFHHVVPLAMPGIMTGTIIGMARALGESAPLLMIGMVAFIVDMPGSVTDAATVLPVQVYIWADSPERAFIEKTSAAIMVLLLFMIAMNGLAIWLRQRFERHY